MKLITTALELQKEFARLLKDYDHYYWSTAWASSSSKLFNELITNKTKIAKIVVGIHFYQTHPDFIEAFLEDKKVRFIQQPEGTFHPKFYLFSNHSNEWELIVGSANFTNEAFTRNTEASVLINNRDLSSIAVYNDAIQFVEKTWAEGTRFNWESLKQYRIIWENQKQKIKSLSGQYGGKKRNSKLIYNVPITNKNWFEFMNEVRNEESNGLGRRLAVIEIAQNLFMKSSSFSAMKEDERKFIAGISNKLLTNIEEDWRFFGSMNASGIFKNRIKENDENISKALDQIPLSGQITKHHYNNFIKCFSKAIEGTYLAPATRLLCMKRPDTFICLDSKNKSKLCEDFGISKSSIDFDRYWDDIIERIYDCNWWKNPNPKSIQEEKVSCARAAFLDSLYYEGL